LDYLVTSLYFHPQICPTHKIPAYPLEPSAESNIFPNMAGRPFTLEQIEAQFRGLAALVANAQGITGKIIIHKATSPGDIRLQLELEGDPQRVAEAAGVFAACTR
jgi:hypothetical protein